MALYLRQLKLGPMENFVYLVGPATGSEVLVVDPAWDMAAIEAAAGADGKVLSGAFVSHSHGDHINALPDLLEGYDVPVYVHRAELDFSPSLRALGSSARPLSGGDELRVGEATFKALHTPGHTPGSQCLLGEGAVVSGDTLFIHACGRCDFEGGSMDDMHHSLRHVLGKLPEDTVLYPGHDYSDVPSAQLSEVRMKNPYLQAHDLAAFVALRSRPRG